MRAWHRACSGTVVCLDNLTKEGRCHHAVPHRSVHSSRDVRSAAYHDTTRQAVTQSALVKDCMFGRVPVSPLMDQSSKRLRAEEGMRRLISWTDKSPTQPEQKKAKVHRVTGEAIDASG